MAFRRWAVWHGTWWMVQYSLDGTFSLGLHLDPITRTENSGARYGPYLELHLGPAAVSVGRNPAAAWSHTLIRPLWEPPWL